MSHDDVLNPATFDPAISVREDLYRHVNGPALAAMTIPDDKSSWGTFMALRDAAQEAVHQLITGLAPGATAGTPEQQIADLYASYMDTATLEARGLAPLAEPLAAVDAIDSLPALARTSGSLFAEGVGAWLYLYVDNDPDDPARQIATVGQAGLGLPDEAYYRTEEHADIREAYVAHMERMFALAGLDDPTASARMVMDLETRLAACHWDRVRCRDRVALYNPMSLDDLDALAPSMQLPLFMDALGATRAQLAELNVAQPSFFVDAAPLFAEDNLAAWKAWLRWRVLCSMAFTLTQAFEQERFGFVGTTLSGTPDMEPRERRAVNAVEGVLGEPVGRLYVAKHFSPTAKARMDELVANLIEAYRDSISGLDWMTQATKAEALDKLSKFAPRIGYPDSWRDFSALEIRPDDLAGNMRRASLFETAHELGKIGKPFNPDEWGMSPQTVNAYYHSFHNEIVFPAAILQPPFFDENADDAVNYGGIGAVIGHEIGHGFDDQGSTCDGDGRLRNWWTDEDRAAFTARTEALIAQYDALEPEETPGHRVNGALTIGENIGDLGGLSIALKAYLASRDGAEDPMVGGLTGVQRVFLSYARIWQNKIRPEAMLQRLAVDPHSPGEFRANQIARNVDAFHEAFGTQPGDGMWLDPSERVRIW